MMIIIMIIIKKCNNSNFNDYNNDSNFNDYTNNDNNNNNYSNFNDNVVISL